MSTVAKPVGTVRLWLGVLLAPSAWLVAEGVGYVLAARLCEPAAGVASSPDVAHARAVHVVVCVVCFVVAILGLYAAFANWRDVRGSTEAREGRMMFMSAGGAFTSALFATGIVLFAAPGFVVNACNQAR